MTGEVRPKQIGFTEVSVEVGTMDHDQSQVQSLSNLIPLFTFALKLLTLHCVCNVALPTVSTVAISR